MNITKIWFPFFLFITLFFTSLSSQSEAVGQFNLQESLREKIEQRWELFQNGRPWSLFEPNMTDLFIKDEFTNLQMIRNALWESPGYERAEALIVANLIRAKECAAFAFNNTTPFYNASTVFIGNHTYIACEGPRSKDVGSFFKLMKSQGVTHLLRLTDAYEGKIKKCHPYWEGLLRVSLDKEYLEIPLADELYWVRAYDMAYWKDHQGIDPEKLLAVVLQVKKDLEKTQGLLLVHCSAGVGRTGTFLAALAIVDAIDQGNPLSIEEIVFRLSLQRAHSVARLDQYMTLYRLAEIYSRGDP